MKKTRTCSILTGLFCIFSTFVAAQQAAGPDIEFMTPTYDFGRVMAGPRVNYDFVFKNTGTEELRITGIRASCGCTTSGAWDKVVKPGQTGKIPITLATAGYGGSIKHSIRVATNVPEKKTVTLYIQGQLWDPVELNPRSAYLGANVKKDAVETRSIQIKSNLDEPVQILDVKSNNSKFSGKIETVEEGKLYHLVVSTAPPLDEGANRADFIIKTSSEKLPQLKLTASCYVQPPVKVQPQRIMVPAGALDRATQRVIHVSHSDGTPLKLSDVQLTCEDKEKAEVSVTDIAEGRRYRIMLKLAEGFEMKPGEKCLLQFKTDDSSAPSVEIPFHEVQVPKKLN